MGYMNSITTNIAVIFQYVVGILQEVNEAGPSIVNYSTHYSMYNLI
jgi:hypothetical protein